MNAPGPTDHELLRLARVVASERDGIRRITLVGFSPLMTFLAALAAMALIGAFAYPLATMILGRPIPPALWVMSGAGAGLIAVLLALRKAARRRRGELDVAIDPLAQTLALPQNFGRRETFVLPFGVIRNIAPAESVPRNPDVLDAHTCGTRTYKEVLIEPRVKPAETDHRAEMSYVVLVEWPAADGQPIVAPLVRWSSRQRATALALWLRRQVGLGDAGR